MTQDPKLVVRRFFEEVWNQRRGEALEELLTEESVCFGDDGPLRGPREFRERQHTPFLAAFSDLHVSLEGMLAQGDEVVRWTAAGTHTGDGLGFAPTGEAVEFHGMSWIRVQDGKMQEGWQSSNIPEVIRTLAARNA